MEPTTSTRQRDMIHVVVGLLVICLATYAFTHLSLDNVPGPTKRPNGDCCDTQFVNDRWWMAMVVIAIPIWWVTRSSLWAALPALAIPVYATFHIASTTVQRYHDTGWGDGLEVFSYVGSFFHLAIFLTAAAVGVYSWRRRHRQPRDGTEPSEG